MAYPNDGKPIRLRCLETLKSNLEGVRRTYSFHHDMQVVYLLQSEKLVSGTATPAAVIVDEGLDEVVAEFACVQEEHSMPVSIFVVLRAIGGAPEEWVREINWLVADVQKCIADSPQLDGLATYVENRGVTVFESPVDNLAAAEVRIRIVYRTVVGDPASIVQV